MQLNKILKLQPILFAIYFVIFLYNENLDELIFADLLLPFAVIIPIVLLFSIVIGLIIKNDTKSILSSSFFTILFFVYIPLHNVLYEFQIGRHVILLLIFFVCSLIVIFFFIKSKKNFDKLLQISYVIVLVLIIFNISEISFYSNISSITMNENLIQSFSINKQDYRDVYHIILDEHAGTDALQQYYNYNNSKFDNSLRNMGFFIPEKSLSNYLSTYLAIPSILNMDYIEQEFDPQEKESNILVDKMVRNNVVTKIFEENGYQIIYSYNEYNLKPTNNSAHELCNTSIGSTQFMTFILDNTPIFIVQSLIEQGNYSPFVQNRLCVFNELPFLDEEFLGPIFVHAHVLLPHYPFIFSSDGSINPYQTQMTRDEFDSLYLSQLMYTDSLVLELVEKLLAKEPQPIILIQSDHVDRQEETDNSNGYSFSNFAAYYFPNVELKTNDYPLLTPVNSFRILFNNNFGTNYDLLENKMYVIEDNKFKDVTTTLISNNTFNKID